MMRWMLAGCVATVLLCGCSPEKPAKKQPITAEEIAQLLNISWFDIEVPSPAVRCKIEFFRQTHREQPERIGTITTGAALEKLRLYMRRDDSGRLHLSANSSRYIFDSGYIDAVLATSPVLPALKSGMFFYKYITDKEKSISGDYHRLSPGESGLSVKVTPLDKDQQNSASEEIQRN